MNVMSMVAEALEKHGKPVTEFLISPPLNPAFAKLAVMDCLRAHMAKAFPKLTFIISCEFPFRDATEFVIMPVMGAGHPTDPDRIVMCQKPTRNEMDRLHVALQGFDPGAPLRFLN